MINEQENDFAEPNTPRYDLGCLIGDISEGFYYCSYNDHDVFRAWKLKTLNEHWEKYMDTMDRQRCGYMDDIFNKYHPEGNANKDWEGLLDRLYVLAEGWPTGWLSGYVPIEELIKKHEYALE